ncbi:MAG TPA: hypothetical protein PKE06_17315, partial [Flavilitoribacter sp.]|nr:hypothetical protein [Flavilitoribacter sp.]
MKHCYKLTAKVSSFFIDTFLILLLGLFAQQAMGQLAITAAASCDDGAGNNAAQDSYYVEVSAVSGGSGNYDVTIDGTTI